MNAFQSDGRHPELVGRDVFDESIFPAKKRRQALQIALKRSKWATIDGPAHRQR